ncbi:hypothetical protein PYW08_015933 [Mythimna loreyi]|uniref:Uncharacterized protein n=1 Tax=Mythimna loreyi TaxID=667449 RepID=A0ACC2QS30_9NEOP|nr:hypothetical protein PYW08_015933 [Mythimna loreyi]
MCLFNDLSKTVCHPEKKMGFGAMILWLIILLVFGWYLGFIALHFYVSLIPFTVCIPACQGLTDILWQGVEFPRYCAERMMD